MDSKTVLVFYLVQVAIATVVGCLFVRPATALVNSRIKTLPKIREPSYPQAFSVVLMAQGIAAALPFCFHVSPELFGIDLTLLAPIAALMGFGVYCCAFAVIFSSIRETSIERGFAVALASAVIQTFVLILVVLTMKTLSDYLAG